MYRFFVFVNELRELPIEMLREELWIEFTLFGLLTRIPIKIPPKDQKTIKIHKLRCHRS